MGRKVWFDQRVLHNKDPHLATAPACFGYYMDFDNPAAKASSVQNKHHNLQRYMSVSDTLRQKNLSDYIVHRKLYLHFHQNIVDTHN